MRSSIVVSSFSGLLTRMLTGQVTISLLGYGRMSDAGSQKGGQPVIVIARLENERHPIMEGDNDVIRLGRFDRERAYPLVTRRVLPIFPQAAKANERRSRRAIGYGCFALPLAFHS
jgi:hypothetical protein